MKTKRKKEPLWNQKKLDAFMGGPSDRELIFEAFKEIKSLRDRVKVLEDLLDP